jgi:hypothetical protein
VNYLGYDRGRVVALRRRLGDLADEAAALRFGDPLAADAAAAYRGAVTLMTGWLPVLTLIDACGFASPYRPVALDQADPSRLDVLHPADAAWATVTDPRAAAPVSAADHARHVAEYLSSADLTAVVNDGGRQRELARVLAVALADNDQRAAFLAALGPEAFSRVSEDLARIVSAKGASAAATRHADEAVAILATLARAFGAADRQGAIDGRLWENVLGGQTEAYATALLLRSAALAPEALARIALAVWDRWNTRPLDDIDERAATSEQTPAILVDVLRAEPLAAREVLGRLDDDGLALLFGPALDQDRVRDLLLASADPRLGPPDDAEASVVNVVRFLATHQDLAGGVHDAMGAYIGPYLENLLGDCDLSGYPARRWDLGRPDPLPLVAWIPRSETAATAMEAYLDAIVTARLGALAATGTFDGQLVHHLGAIAGAVDGLVGDAHVLAAEHQNELWTAIGATLSTVVTTGAVATLNVAGLGASDLIGLSVDAGVTWILGRWTAADGPGAPTPLATAVAAEGDTIEQRRGRREAAYLGAMFAVGRSTGALPQSAAPPPFDPSEPYLATRNRWLASASDPADRAGRIELWHAAEDFDAGMSARLSRFPSPTACPAVTSG